MDNLDQYVADNIKSEFVLVSLNCLKDTSEAVFDVQAMLDPNKLRQCIQAVCIAAPDADIGVMFKALVNDAIGLVAEQDLITKFEKEEA